MSVPSSPINPSPTSPIPKKSPVISSGRGGSGNIRATSKLKQDDGINEVEILQKRRAEAALNPRVKIKYTGRGGSGNIRAASSAQSIPFDASADPDDDYEQIVLQGAQLAKRDKTPSTGRGGLGNSARPRSKSFGTANVGLKAKKDKSRRRRSFASLRFTATSFSSSEHYHVSSEISRISSDTASISLSIPSSLSPTPSPSSAGLTLPRVSFRPSSVRSTPPPHVIIPTDPLAARARSASHPTLVLPPSPISPRLSAPNLTIKSPTERQRRIAECRKTLAEPYINMPPFDDAAPYSPHLNSLPPPPPLTPHHPPLTPPPSAPVPPTPVSPPHKLQKVARSSPGPSHADTAPAPSPARWWKRNKRRTTTKTSTPPPSTNTTAPLQPDDRNPSPHSHPSPSPSPNNSDTPAPAPAPALRTNMNAMAMVDQVAVDAEAAEVRMREVMGHLEEVGKRAMEVRMRMRGEGIRGGVYVREVEEEEEERGYVKEKGGREMVYRQSRYVQQQHQQQHPQLPPQAPRYAPGYVQKQQPQRYGYGYGGRVHPHPHPHPHPHGPLDPGRESESEYETEESESIIAYAADEDDEDEDADVYGVNETIRMHHGGIPSRAASSMWALHAVEEEDPEFVSFLEF